LSSSCEEHVDRMIAKANERVWLTVNSADNCGINRVLTQPNFKSRVDVRLIVPESIEWSLIEGNLPSRINLRFCDGGSLKKGVCIIDNNAFAGVLDLTCKNPTQCLRRLQLDTALKTFEDMWRIAKPFHTSEVRISRPNLNTLPSFMRWYLHIKLEPLISYARLTLKGVTFRFRVKLTRLMRGRWYPFTLLEPEVQGVLKKNHFKEPTPIQLLAIPKVLSGKNVLVIAPTGSGKTESVVLPILSLLVREKKRKQLKGVRVLYIAPMRALAKNMAERISKYAEEVLGQMPKPVMEWHGDVEKKVRKAICSSPPAILVTTPESLEAIIDRWCEKILKNVRYVIVDEIHELVGSKRGEQVLLLIERIKDSKIRRVQRLFLSATLPNPSKVARLLGGSDGPVTVVEDPNIRKLKIELHTTRDSESSLADTLSDMLGDSRGYIIFANSRALTEVLHYQLTERGVSDIRVYHSSISHEERRKTEKMFEDGMLRGLVATRALELGIDISGVEKVALVGSPKVPEYLVQRFGRGSHKPHQTSSGLAVAIDEEDLLEILALAQLASRKKLAERVSGVPSLDVISRELIAEALRASKKEEKCIKLSNVIKTFSNAFPGKACHFNSFERVAEDLVAHLEDKDVIEECGEDLIALGKSFYKLWPKNSIGKFFSFIPPRKEVKVVEGGKELGTIDAINLVFLKPGYVIRLGGGLWRVKRIRASEVIVENVRDEEFAIPIWKSGGIPTHQIVAIEVCRLLGRLNKLVGRGNIVKLGNIEVVFKGDVKQILGNLTKDDLSLPDPRFVIVDMLTSKALREASPKIKELAKHPYSIVATVLIYPFGSLIANTIASALWGKVSKGDILYIVPKPLGILVVHKAGFDVVKHLLDLDESTIKNAAKNSPYIHVVANEIARSLGCRKLQDDTSCKRILGQEVLKQTLHRFYDLESTLRLVSWLRSGNIKMKMRRVLEPEGAHILTEILFGDILKLQRHTQ